MPYYPTAFYMAGCSPRQIRMQRRLYYIDLRRMGFSRQGARIRTDIEFPRKERK